MIYTLEDILEDLCNDFCETNQERLKEIKDEVLEKYKRV